GHWASWDLPSRPNPSPTGPREIAPARIAENQAFAALRNGRAAHREPAHRDFQPRQAPPCDAIRRPDRTLETDPASGPTRAFSPHAYNAVQQLEKCVKSAARGIARAFLPRAAEARIIVPL